MTIVIKRYMALCSMFLLSVFALSAQDLMRKVPADANFVLQLQSKNATQHLNMQELNAALTKLGFFKEFADKNMEKLEDIGVDWEANSYLYSRVTDSIIYVGAFIPLADQSKFANFINPDAKPVQNMQGMQSYFVQGTKMRVSWNDDMAFILVGSDVYNYFSRPEVKERFGLKDDSYDHSYAVDDYDTWADTVYEEIDTTWIEEYAAEAADSAMVVETYVDTVDMIEDGPIMIAPPKVDYDDEDYEDYAYVDSMLERDEYSDDYYKEYNERYMYNDSVKSNIIQQWMDTEFNHVISNQHGSYTGSKAFLKKSNNTIAQVEIKNFDKLMGLYNPAQLVYGTMLGVTPKFDYGITAINGSINVDKNKLIFGADIQLDDQMTGYYKDIYKGKLNPKFYRYLDKDALGFISFNMSTEAYVKHFPALMQRYYKGWMSQYDEAIELGATVLDIMLDEKAIGKVFKGDNLFVVNGVTNKEVTYTDYDYDDDFNTVETKRTKMEAIPQFMWMFSSDDTRIFEKLFQIGIREGQLIEDAGVFALKVKGSESITPYITIKDGIVFVGNDEDKMRAIQSGRVTDKGHADYIKLAKNNKLALLFNTKRVPALIKELDLPVVKSMQSTVNELEEYGDFYMLSKGMKGNTFSSEMGLEFPNRKENALAFLLDVIINLTK